MGGKGYSENHTIYWGTPKDWFSKLNEEFKFDLDPCTQPNNPLGLARFFTEIDNGLAQEWSGRVFVNCPYGGENLHKWFEKCFWQWQKGNCEVIVMLAPIRGFDSKRHHNFICKCRGKPSPTGATCNGYRDGIEIRFIAGRLKFTDLLHPEKEPHAGTFGSMLIIFRRREQGAYIPYPPENQMIV